MNKDLIKKFKENLEQELDTLESELKSVGRVNPENPGDWEPVPADQDLQASDSNEMGDKFEEYEENTAILKPLEIRFNSIKKALEKIDSGNDYGVCEFCGKEIEADRLNADPAAPTCKAHME